KEASASFGIIVPAYTPAGVAEIGRTEVMVGNETGIALRYGGAYNYILVESRPREQHVSSMHGTMVDLGFTYAVLTGDKQRTLHWTSDGVEYQLSSGDLPVEEMQKIALSVQGQIGK